MVKEREEQPKIPPTSSVFEVGKIKELIQLMQEHELSEVDLKQADQRIRLRRGTALTSAAANPTPTFAAPVAAASNPTPTPPPTDNCITINSPTIGTFYSRPKPDAPNFVKVGDTVNPETIVCLVEAMKMFNEIPAGVSGKIVEMLVKNEEAVDNNKPLFKVMPS